MKHGGNLVLSKVYCASSGTRCSESVQGIMKSQDYQGLLGWNVLPSVRRHGLSHTSWVQPKTPRSGSEQNVTFLKCLSEPWSESWWTSVKGDETFRPSNLSQLEQFADKEWVKIPAEVSERELQETLYCNDNKILDRFHPFCQGQFH